MLEEDDEEEEGEEEDEVRTSHPKASNGQWFPYPALLIFSLFSWGEVVQRP